MLWGGGEDIASIGADVNRWSTPMQKVNDLSRCLTPLEPDSTLIAVIKMSLWSWLVAGIVPGVERQPLKKLAVDESVLLKLLHRWRGEAEKAGYMIKRIAVAFEAGRDGFWLARWLRARDTRFYQPDLGSELDSPFARDAVPQYPRGEHKRPFHHARTRARWPPHSYARRFAKNAAALCLSIETLN
jgi:hypothetical protein